MPTVSIDRLLEMLPHRVHDYRAALLCDDMVAEERCRSAVCSVLEYLLEKLVDGSERWERGAWVDGVLAGTFDVSAMGLAVDGVAVWTGPRGWFEDPFTARVNLSADGFSVLEYSLKFGDAQSGLGKYPCKPNSSHHYKPPPSEWCFSFDSDTAFRYAV